MRVRLLSLSQQLGVNIHAFSQQRGLIAPRNSRYTEVERSHNDLTLTLVDFSTLPDDEQILKIMMVDEPELLAKMRCIIYLKRLTGDNTVLLSTPYFPGISASGL